MLQGEFTDTIDSFGGGSEAKAHDVDQDGSDGRGRKRQEGD
jgi:hypothetical protein